MPIDVGLLGRVDEVPGRFFVATQFLHLVGFPLIPLGSFVVADNPAQLDRQSRLVDTATGIAFGLQADPYEACKQVRIPLSGRSVAAAYLTPPLVITSYFSVIVLVLFVGLRVFIGNPNGNGPQLWTFPLLLALALGSMMGRRLLYRWSQPSDERIAELEQLLGQKPSFIRDR